MKKILVIDNDKTITDFFNVFLTEQGYIVFSANTKKQAFELVAEKKADLIFLDINMPMMGGVFVAETIKHIRQKNKAKIIIISGSGFDNFFIEVLNNKLADGYLLKPSDINELKISLKEVI